jgi:hypothetical protein
LSPHQTIWSKRCLDNAESFAGYASKNTARWPRKGVSQVRSIAAFQNCIDSVSPFSCLHMLRVLDLEDCSLEGSKKLSIGNLIHLRYLRIKTDLEVLPRGIGKLQFLQVLIRERGRVELPESIFGLPQLMSTRCCLLSTYRKSAEEPYSLPPPAASVHPHQTTPSIAGNDAGECGQGHACEVLAAVAVAGPVLFGLGGDGVHAARHEAEVVGEGEQALARPERADGVPGMKWSARETRLSSAWSSDMPRRSAAQRSGTAVAGVTSTFTP